MEKSRRNDCQRQSDFRNTKAGEWRTNGCLALGRRSLRYHQKYATACRIRNQKKVLLIWIDKNLRKLVCF